MGLVSLNHYGRKELVELICNNTPLHYGRVYYNEKLVNSYQFNTHIENKISVIEKRSHLVEDLNIIENIFMLKKKCKMYFMKPKILCSQLNHFTKELNLEFNGTELIKNITVYERKLIELIKATIMGNKLIIIDNISEIISENELKKFQQFLIHYSKKGFSILYVSNQLEETFAICNRVAIMENGQILRVLDGQDLTKDKIAPYQVSIPYKQEVKEYLNDAEGFFQFKNVYYNRMRNLSFFVREAECITLLDTEHLLLQDFIDLLVEPKKIEQGEILYHHIGYSEKKGRNHIQKGICIINQSPIENALFKEMSYIDNLCFLLEQKIEGLRLNKRIKHSIMKEYERYVGEDIYKKNITNLSTRSYYNLVYYSVHLCKPSIVFLIQPFLQADLYSRLHIIHLIRQLKKRGIAVVILATSLFENLMICDRLYVIQDGKCKHEYKKEELAYLEDTNFKS